MSERSVVLVTGATGAIGAEVCAALARQPEFKVRATLHTPEKRRLLPENVETVEFDFQDPSSIDAALDGVNKLFLLAPGGPVGPSFTKSVVDALAHHSVDQIVKQSSYAPEKGPQAPTDLWALETEEAVKSTGIEWTFLRPPWCNQSWTRGYFAPMVASGVLAFPFGQGRSGWLDTRDIAEVVRVIFSTAGHGEKIYTLTGPEAITLGVIAEELSAASNRRIVYKDLTDQEWIDACLATGQPMPVAQATLALIAKTRDGFAEEITDTVELLTGSRARTFSEYAGDYASEVAALYDSPGPSQPAPAV